MPGGEDVEGTTDEGGVAGEKSRGAANKNATRASTRRGDRMGAKREAPGGPHFQFRVNAEIP